MRQPPRPVLIGVAITAALALLISMQPFASADSRGGGWWWWRLFHRPASGTATQPAPAVSQAAAEQPAPAEGASAAPPEAGGGSVSGGHSAAHQGVGLAYNAAKIPKFGAGSSTYDIQPTSDKLDTDPDGIGAFRTKCYPSHMLPDDPIVKFKEPGRSHLHTYWGNRDANSDSDYKSLRSRGDGTCLGGIANRSAYWVPAVIDTSTGTPIAPEKIFVYYKSGYKDVDPRSIIPLPEGLRMVVGDAGAKSAQPEQGWHCGEGEPDSPTIPTNCGSELTTMTVHFKQCWDGRLDDPVDHKSHMADPVKGRCVAPHDKAIPAITYHVFYKTTSSVRSWRLSSDPKDGPPGLTVHGDWFGGWDPELVKTWTSKCVNKPGVSCRMHLVGDGRAMKEPPGR